MKNYLENNTESGEAKPMSLKERTNLKNRHLAFFEKLFIDSLSLHFPFFLIKKKQKQSSLRIKRLNFLFGGVKQYTLTLCIPMNNKKTS
jgi:hypothetical protein